MVWEATGPPGSRVGWFGLAQGGLVGPVARPAWFGYRIRKIPGIGAERHSDCLIGCASPIQVLGSGGEASSKMTLVQHSIKRKGIHIFKRKYMKNLRQILVNFYFTMVHEHQGKPTWLRPC